MTVHSMPDNGGTGNAYAQQPDSCGESLVNALGVTALR